MRIKTIQTSNKNFILRCRDGKRTETRIGMEGICITHSCIQELGWRVSVLPIPAYMQEWVIQIPSIPILVSVLFPSLHLKYFRIKFLLLVTYIGTMQGTGACKIVLEYMYCKLHLTVNVVRKLARSILVVVHLFLHFAFHLARALNFQMLIRHTYANTAQ